MVLLFRGLGTVCCLSSRPGLKYGPLSVQTEPGRLIREFQLVYRHCLQDLRVINVVGPTPLVPAIALFLHFPLRFIYD